MAKAKPRLERIAEPELIDDYIKISSPAVWVVLGIIIAVIVAAGIWAMAGRLDITTPGYLTVSRGESVLWLSEADAAKLHAGTEVEAAGTSGLVVTTAGAPQAVTEVVTDAQDGETLQRLGEWVCPFTVSINLPTGSYPATVVLESYSPAQLVLGGSSADTEAV